MQLLQTLTAKAVGGTPLTVDEAMALNDKYTTDQLADAADQVRRARVGTRLDTCSIVNARSGLCSEDCKWCAQSRFHHTGVEEYEIVDTNEMLELLKQSTDHGVGRFSLVTSGRRVSPEQIDRFCALYRLARKHSTIGLCASMGLLGIESMRKLREAGVTRYHCNLETSASNFANLCSTHTHADKIATIKAARQAGMEVCSGGIIGMGETLRQRLELATEAREAGSCSIPVNLLNPIPGTPLESTPLLEEDEIIRSVALMRMVAPDCAIRFAGGRARISQKATERMLRGGANAVLVGNMLTTVGNNMDQDFTLLRKMGYEG